VVPLPLLAVEGTTPPSLTLGHSNSFTAPMSADSAAV